MSLCRTWRQDTAANQTMFDKKGLRYDAGDWFAEILEDNWMSYDVIQRKMISQQEWQEILQPHSVPRLPYQCFAVEEFQYEVQEQVQPQAQAQPLSQQQPWPRTFHVKGWTVEQSLLPLSVPVQGALKTEQIQEQTLSQQQQPEQLKQQNKRNKRSMISGRLSSNQSSLVQRQQPYPKQSVEHSPSKKSRSSAPPRRDYQSDLQVQSWTPLELHLTLPSQSELRGPSSQRQKVNSKHSPRQPKMLPVRLQVRHSNPSPSKAHQLFSTVCQIQD